MNSKRFRVLIGTIFSVTFLISCSQKSPHGIPSGGVEALIPLPKSISLIGEGEDIKSFFSGEDLRVQGFDNLGETSGVVETWLLGVGVEVRTDFPTNANLVFEIKEN